MGAHYSTDYHNHDPVNSIDNSNRFYDFILHVTDLERIEQGWRIEFPNPEAINKTEEHWKETTIISVQGKYNQGKTWFINRLVGTDLPSGHNLATKGLSFKTVTVHHNLTRPLIFLDNEGIHSPISATQGCTILDGIARRKAKEQFLRDVSVRMADVNILVTTVFTDTDQEQIITLCQSIADKGGDVNSNPILFIHNYKDCDLLEAKELFNNQVVNIYKNSRSKIVGDAVVCQEKITGTTTTTRDPIVIQIFHYYLCRDSDGENKLWNNKIIEQIKNKLFNLQEIMGRELAPLQFLKHHCEESIQNYLQEIRNLCLEEEQNIFKKFLIACGSSQAESNNSHYTMLQHRLRQLNYITHKIKEKEKKKNQFTAVFTALNKKKKLDLKIPSADYIKDEAIKWLTVNSDFQHGEQSTLFSFMPLLPTGLPKTWDNYIDTIKQSDNGDHLTLYAIAHALNIRINIVTSILSPEMFSINIGGKITVELGHWHTNNFISIASEHPDKTLTDFHNLESDIPIMLLKSNTVNIVYLRTFKITPNVGVEFENQTPQKKLLPIIGEIEGGHRVLWFEIPNSDDLEAEVDSVNGKKLIISGSTREYPHRLLQGKYQHGKWTYTYEIPDGFRYDPNDDDATAYEDGVLKIILKKGILPNIRRKIKK